MRGGLEGRRKPNKGEFEGACPLMHAPPRAVRDRAAAVSEGCRGAPCHVLSVAKV